MRARASTTNRVRRRLASLLAVALVVVGVLSAHLARVGHLVFVAHVRCEHGALVHAHAREPSHEAAAPARGVAVSEGATLDDEHDHCDGLPPVLGVVDALAPPAMARILAWTTEVAAVRARHVARPVAPLALAPKASPPA